MKEQSKILLLNFKEAIERCVDKDYDSFIDTVESSYESLLTYAQDSYENSRDVLQQMLGIMARVEPKFINYQFWEIDKNLDNAIGPLKNDGSDCPQWQDFINQEWEDEDIKSLIERAYESMGSQHFNISEADLSIANAFSLQERKIFVSFIVDSIQRYGLQTNWKKDIIDCNIVYLNFLHSVSSKDSLLPLFYFFSPNVIEHIALSGEPQLSRDLAEGILKAGFTDNYSYLGFLVMARAYTAVHNVLAGSLFLYISLVQSEGKGHIESRYYFEVYWTIVKLMREGHIYKESLLSKLTSKISLLHLKDYEYLSFSHTVFSVKASFRADDPLLTEEIAIFLDCNREPIFKNLEHSALPWYTLCQALKKYQTEKDYSRLALYEAIFAKMIESPDDNIIVNYYEGKDLSCRVKELLYKLEKTRNVEDYVKDNRLLMLFSSKLLDDAVKRDSPEDFILAMRARCDFSFYKEDIPISCEQAKVEVEQVNGDLLSAPYSDLSLLNHFSCKDVGDVILLVGRGEKGSQIMKLLGEGYSFCTYKSWNTKSVESIFGESIIFKSSIKKSGSPVYYKTLKDFEDETKAIAEHSSSYQLPIPQVASRLLIAKDYEYCEYPANLILDDRTEKFCGELCPVANIISTEFLISTNITDNLTDRYKKSFWLPLESQDLTFYSIYGQVEKILKQYGFEFVDKLKPNNPVSSDLNVICVHGGSKISNEEVFYTDSERIPNIMHIVGKGKMLIMFVCHSGTASHTSYDNGVHSVIKRFLRMGYDSVIAPMWALSSEIIPIWFSHFMARLDAGDEVIDATYKANMKVKECFPTPSAWACLHLFGNPYLRVSKN